MRLKLKRLSSQYVKLLRIINGTHSRGFEFHAEQYYNCKTVLNKLRLELNN